mmetsp:Transcript_124569/g.346864  ORF Transcript_124569/g.346864 Transcript_124569/m.346864 type:complete len:216 (+) Transcript_124569:3819-4466(+)
MVLANPQHKHELVGELVERKGCRDLLDAGTRRCGEVDGPRKHPTAVLVPRAVVQHDVLVRVGCHLHGAARWPDGSNHHKSETADRPRDHPLGRIGGHGGRDALHGCFHLLLGPRKVDCEVRVAVLDPLVRRAVEHEAHRVWLVILKCQEDCAPPIWLRRRELRLHRTRHGVADGKAPGQNRRWWLTPTATGSFDGTPMEHQTICAETLHTDLKHL